MAKPNVKRVVVNGEHRIVKYDVILNSDIIVECDEKNALYRFYFPIDKENNIYNVGNFPKPVLDAFVMAKIEQNLRRVGEKTKGVKSALDKIDIG